MTNLLLILVKMIENSVPTARKRPATSLQRPSN